MAGMRILRLAQEIYPDVMGGGAYHAYALSRDQAKLGHEVDVITVSNKQNSIEPNPEFEINRFSPTLSPLGNDISILAIAEILRSVNKYDIVHAHAHFYTLSNVSALLRKVSNVPLVVTNHSLISQSVSKWVAKSHLKTVGKWTFDAADAVFCYSESEKSRIERLGVSSNIYVVSNGIDHEKFCPDKNVVQFPLSGDGNVLYVGRLVEGKSPIDLVDAFKNVLQAREDADLYFVGEGPLENEIQRHARKREISESVHLLGRIPYDKMPQLYRSANVVVLPSKSEGMPRTVLESLLCETPVVSTNLEQISDIVNSGGYTVDIGDIPAISSAIVKILSDRSLEEKLGENGREYLIENGYTWKTTVEHTTNHMKKVLDTSL